jgi:hypothetical protein
MKKPALVLGGLLILSIGKGYFNNISPTPMASAKVLIARRLAITRLPAFGKRRSINFTT